MGSSSGEGMLRRPGTGRAAFRCQTAGKVRMKGKDYVMKDGDVVEFREGGIFGSGRE
jgi:ketosteroid isomerase-like protein